MMSHAIDHELNGAVLLMCSELLPNGFDLAEQGAPETFEALCEHVDRTQRFLIYSAASDQTIFGSAEVNHAFRAWHDYHHYWAKLPFTPEGERAAYTLQSVDLIRRFGDCPKVWRWIALLNAEINGQLEYAAQHNGAFPTNQASFVLAYLTSPSTAINSDF